MTLSIIVAMSQNGVIGKDNKIPWHLSEDLKRFKQLTMGHPIVMGRKTCQSIGKPLPGRENIVITRDPKFLSEGVRVVHSLDEAIKGQKPDEEIFVIGGAEIYRLALPPAEKIYLTLVERKFGGDTYFPEPEFENRFEKIEETNVLLSEKNGLPYRFVAFRRKFKS
ncbi:MAG: dihydrofolate reductase [Deltaproteobacteria bacterium]|nr:dihydrofolate reductase [Deltaproteobacteria bacterium]